MTDSGKINPQIKSQSNPAKCEFYDICVRDRDSSIRHMAEVSTKIEAVGQRVAEIAEIIQKDSSQHWDSIARLTERIANEALARTRAIYDEATARMEAVSKEKQERMNGLKSLSEEVKYGKGKAVASAIVISALISITGLLIGIILKGATP